MAELTKEDIIVTERDSQQQLVPFKSHVEQDDKFGKCVTFGQHDNNNVRQGLNRKIVVKTDGHGYIREGQFKDNKPRGFARYMYTVGLMYIGYQKDERFHGYGKKVFHGHVKLGLWQNGLFIQSSDEVT